MIKRKETFLSNRRVLPGNGTTFTKVDDAMKQEESNKISVSQNFPKECPVLFNKTIYYLSNSGLRSPVMSKKVFS